MIETREPAAPDRMASSAVYDFTDAVLSELRRQGLSKRQLARRMLLNESNVSRMLRCDPGTRVNTLARVALALGCSLEIRLVRP